MANNVDFGIIIWQINDIAKAKLQSLLDSVSANKSEFDGEGIFADLLGAGEDDRDDIDWNSNNVGAKWCNLSDWDAECEPFTISGYSAGSAPTKGLENLLENLEKSDDKIIASITFKDEYFNFAGAYIYLGSEVYDGLDWESDEIIEEGIKLIDGLSSDDYSDQEWSNTESKEIWDEAKVEVVDGLQNTLVDREVENLQKQLS